MRITGFIFIVITLFTRCNLSDDLENQISIKVESINCDTKLPRVNTFDTIVIKKVGNGIIKKTFDKVGEYITDSAGSVRIKIDKSKEYHISLYGKNVFGWANLNENCLVDNQKVSIEASSKEKN